VYRWTKQNWLKRLFWGFKVVQGHRCWYVRKSRQQRKSVSICNHSRARLVDSSRNHTFHGGTQIWCARRPTEDSLNLGGQTLHRWNLRLMPNISYARSPGLSWMVSAQLTLKMCIAAQNRKKKSLKTPILGVQGRSRSSVLVPMESSSAVLLMISTKSVSICNHSRARLVDSSRNRTFHGVPKFDALVRRTHWT